MPLKPGKKNIGKNIAELTHSYEKKGKIGNSVPENFEKARKQAIAISLSEVDASKKKAPKKKVKAYKKFLESLLIPENLENKFVLECAMMGFQAIFEDVGNVNLDEFTQAYLEAALWSSTDSYDKPLDENYSIQDIAPDSLQKLVNLCKIFQEDNHQILDQCVDPEEGQSNYNYGQAGHDFWLTQNGHGAGFWDRELPGELGQQLTDAAKKWKEINLYVGDDGKIHI